jgi:chemotaxis protein histidine kinase CheA
MDANNLVPAYFDERDELESAFDALSAFDTKHEEQQKQKEQSDLQQQQKDLEAQQQRQLKMEAQQQHQKEIEAQQQRQQKLEAQMQRQNALEEQQRQNALEEQQRQKDLEKQQRQKDLEEQQRQKDLEEQQHQKDLEEQQRQNELNKQQDKTPDEQSPGNTPLPNKDQPVSPKPNPLSELIKIVEEYTKKRKKEHYTHYWIPLFQYTKKDKLDAAQHFINALKNPASMINNFDKAVLNDGRLHKTIKSYLAEHELAIQSHFKSDKPIKTVNQLINALNKQNPVDKLIYQLEHYHKQRAKQPEMYHLSLFPQYTGTEKRTAVAHLLDVLKGENNALTTKDIGALNQGSLGSLIAEFIEEFKAPLREAMNVKRIDNLTDLISACEHNKTGLSLKKN